MSLVDAKSAPVADQFVAHLVGVGQVAVVRDGQRAGVIVHEVGLGVRQHRTAGGRVPGVTHGDVAGQLAQDRPR